MFRLNLEHRPVVLLVWIEYESLNAQLYFDIAQIN